MAQRRSFSEYAIEGGLIPHSYKSIRNEEYDEILKRRLSLAEGEENPQICHTGGIPGAGKTTFYKSNAWNNPPMRHVYIAFDAIMLELASYRVNLQLHGSEIAFNQSEIPARIIGYQLLDEAVQRHANVFLDHSASAESHVQILGDMKRECGYAVHMHYIESDVATAKKRAAERELRTGRYISPDEIAKRDVNMRRLFPEFQKVADSVTRWKNESYCFERILS